LRFSRLARSSSDARCKRRGRIGTTSRLADDLGVPFIERDLDPLEATLAGGFAFSQQKP